MSDHPLPNLIIAGVVKGGTTSVFSYLAEHKDVCPSSKKEAQYFSGYRYNEPVESLDEYRALFSRWDQERYVLEATPGYFEGGQFLAQKIKETLAPETKVVIILRNPVDRFLSFFKYKKSELQLNKDMPLEEYITLCENTPQSQKLLRHNDLYWGLDGGLYSHYLAEWLDVFGDSCKVMFFDDLKSDRAGFMRDLATWLALDPKIYDDLDMAIENKSQAYRSQWLQRLALNVNAQFEVLFRRYPAFKKLLRSVYVRLNAPSFDDSYSKETLEYLEGFYRKSNQDVANLLRLQGVTESNLPSWLTDQTI